MPTFIKYVDHRCEFLLSRRTKLLNFHKQFCKIKLWHIFCVRKNTKSNRVKKQCAHTYANTQRQNECLSEDFRGGLQACSCACACLCRCGAVRPLRQGSQARFQCCAVLSCLFEQLQITKMTSFFFKRKQAAHCTYIVCFKIKK